MVPAEGLFVASLVTPFGAARLLRELRVVSGNCSNFALLDHQQKLAVTCFFKGGAGRGIRTPDFIITNDALYQLSYAGNKGMAWPGGLFCLTSVRSVF